MGPEPDCYATGSTPPKPGDANYVAGETDCTTFTNNIAASAAAIKSAFPGHPMTTWINLTAGGVMTSPSIPSAFDVVSFDCYTPFEQCYFGPDPATLQSRYFSVSEVVENLKTKTQAKIMLMPQACSLRPGET